MRSQWDADRDTVGDQTRRCRSEVIEKSGEMAQACWISALHSLQLENPRKRWSGSEPHVGPSLPCSEDGLDCLEWCC